MRVSEKTRPIIILASPLSRARKMAELEGRHCPCGA
jgi:hypothetical protein